MTALPDGPIGAIDETEATGNGSVIAILKRIRTLSGAAGGGGATQTTLALLNAKFGALGQTTKAGSAPVVLPSDQVVSTSPGSSSKATYMVGVAGLAPAAAATDILEIIGSATKIVRVLGISISGVATAAGAFDFLLTKHSVVDSGGTSTTPTIAPVDSTQAAATAVVKAYTANPTVGTSVGTVVSRKATVTTAAGAIPEVPLVITFGGGAGKEIVLRDNTESLCLNLNGATMTGGSLNVDLIFTEE